MSDDRLPEVSQESNLTTSVMYAGASGDFNPLHFDQGFAAQVSPTGGIIAHGMYSMGLASRLLTEWAGLMVSTPSDLREQNGAAERALTVINEELERRK